MRYKFKAWDKNAKKWYDRVQVGNDSNDANYVCHSVYDEERGWLEFDEHCGTVVQWTGLNDRNGTPIYEGDIIRWHDIVTADFSVVFTDGVFCLDGRSDENFYHHREEISTKWEVIGNIFSKESEPPC